MQSDAIESAYRLKIRELRSQGDEELSQCLERMRSADRPGADYQILHEVGGKLADDAVARCEAAIPELITAHIEAGDTDAASIAERIRAHVVDVVLRTLPGAGLYVSLRGGASTVVMGRQLRQTEEMRFTTRRSSLRNAVGDYVTRSLAAHHARKRNDAGPQNKPSVTGLRDRQKDQKFGILDSPSLLHSDLQLECGTWGRVLIYLDVDNFKALNTRFTERVVDRGILPDLQTLVLRSVRDLGYAYAEGGDEMVLHMPNASIEMGLVLADAVRTAIAGHAFEIEGAVVTLTASFGVAGGREIPGEELVDRANQAKNGAKVSGKNCVALWRNNDVILCTAGAARGTDGPTVSFESGDQGFASASSDAPTRWRRVLDESRAARRRVELDSPHTVELDQRDSGGNALRVDAQLDGWIVLGEVSDTTFDLACPLRGVQGMRVARIPFSQVEDIWLGVEGRLHVRLRRALVWMAETSRLV